MKHIILFILLPVFTQAGQLEVFFEKNFEGEYPALDLTIQDAKELLYQYQNKLTEKINLTFHLIKTLEAKTIQSEVNFPQHDFELSYSFNTAGGKADIKIESKSIQGLVYGIYSFLQEKLSVKFYHPKKIEIPSFMDWPLRESFTVTVKPKFQLKGFHLHTQHPIELTEYLLDEEWGEEGQKEVRKYIDWLVRNGQNYFQLSLLESVKTKKWIPYFKEIETYAHKRGVLIGVSLSLHSIQQKAFMLYRNWPASWCSKKKQITKNIKKLNQINWDYWSVDFKKHEYAGDKSSKIDELKYFIWQELQQYGVKLVENFHVVKQPDHLILPRDSMENAYVNSTASQVHTVMFYDLQDENTPVYEVSDFSHMLSKLKNSNNERETWYFPESAYWVTFDNAIPMMLTPYLEARKNDIDLSYRLKIDGHLTFSTGWEWGYEMVDWSIARWTWDYNEEVQPNDYILGFFKTKAQKELVNRLINLQQEYIKDSNLIEFLTAQAPTDELPKCIFNKEFHPRPPFSYKHLRNKANKDELDYAERKIFLLKKYAHQTSNIIYDLRDNHQSEITNELLDGFEITGLRAKHRAHVMEYLVEKRSFYFDRNRSDHVLDSLLYLAKCDREDAQSIVDQRKLVYKYPNVIIGDRYKGKTAYPFGYLYPVSNLHFWKREELQAKKNKYRAGYKNIYPLLKISGLVN